MGDTTTTNYPYFMAHPFWNTLRIHQQSDTFSTLKSLNHDQQKDYIAEAVKGFYPISYASLLAFKRFSDLADEPESKSIADQIYRVEKGECPLIEGSPMTGILHCDQLKMMFESLINQSISVSDPLEFAVLKEANIAEASLVKAMAICDLIEHTAPYVIHFYQDFLIQCQLAIGVPSEQIQRNYLDEHNLTEGDSCADQHIDMLDRMMGHYLPLKTSDEYIYEQMRFTGLVTTHFEHHRKNMENIRILA